MALMITTVISFAIILGIASWSSIFFLLGTLDSSDASRIDPKPEREFQHLV